MKFVKILILFIILSITLLSSVYATESEEDLADSLEMFSSMLSENTDTLADENEEEQAEAVSISNVSTSSPVVTTSSSSEGDDLSTSDIINIILIAVGLVLIFLGIAILLRSK